MVDIDWNNIHAKFSAKFRDEELGTNNESKGGGPYVDARSVAERLDDVVGPGSWETHYVLVEPQTYGVECTLTVYGISKSDIGYPNEIVGFKPLPDETEIVLRVQSMQDWQKKKYRERIARDTYLHPVTGLPCLKVGSDEPLKAAYSDAFKRVAVQWGIGRYLYPYASKKQREAGEEAPTADGGTVNTATGEKTIPFGPDPRPQSAKAQAVAGHVPNLDAFREEVRAAVVTVAQAENQEATDIFHKAIKETGITTSGGMPKFNLDDLTKLRDWCNRRLEVLV